jgi:charged multivesicular body protein 4
MESIREQMDLSNEISDAISNPVNMGIEVDDVSFDFQLRREIVTGGPPSCTRHVKFELIVCALPLQDELKNELEELEQEQLNERLVGAERAPVHAPVSAGPSRVSHQQGKPDEPFGSTWLTLGMA